MTNQTTQQRVNSRQRNERRAIATRLLLHYIDLATDNSLSWDCRSEIQNIIDSIFDEMNDLSARLDALEAKTND